MQALHLYETSMTWDDISAIAVTRPLLGVHPQEDHVPSKLFGISTTLLKKLSFAL